MKTAPSDQLRVHVAIVPVLLVTLSAIIGLPPVLGAESILRRFEGDPEGGFREPWHTHLGFVEVLGIRQKAPHLSIRWRSERLADRLDAPLVTFAWTGALGAGRGDTGGFTIFVEGRAAADFDVAREPMRFAGREPGCRWLYDPVWVYTNGADSSGHFFLSVPAGWLKPGRTASIEVRGRECDRNRWFGLLRGDPPRAVPERQSRP